MTQQSAAPVSHVALDPRRSVVVEACAGSGKTWLLVSRIVRILLDGADPSQILAITFTRKAAQEMQTRLQEWLFDLATKDDAFIHRFFADRGLTAMSDEQLRRARTLYGAVLLAQPGLTVSTFHGWFMQVLQRAPLNSGISQGMALLEHADALEQEAWDALLVDLRSQPDGAVARHMGWLFSEYGLLTATNFLQGFLAKRTEWLSYTQGQRDPLAYALARLTDTLAVDMSRDPAADWGASPEASDAIHEFVYCLSDNGTPSQKKKAAELDHAWKDCADAERFSRVWPLLFTQAGEPRKIKPTKDQLPTESFYSSLEELQATLQAAQDIYVEQQAFRMNESVLTCGVALLAKYQALKAQRQQIDFADLEWQLFVLLQQSEHAETMQYRLDSRYRHVLLDEFQDTNPLQWQIMRAWFDAAVAVETQPSVFIVGDPKQSIYRFRRADSRLFSVAREYLKANFRAAGIENSTTRRSAQPIVDAVNAVFSGQPDGFQFVEHNTHQSSLPGHIEILPLAYPPALAAPAPVAPGLVLRNPLLEARPNEAGGARELEAAQFAATLDAMVNDWVVEGSSGPRRARFGDVMVLVRNRTHLSVYEDALRARRIPFISSRRGGLLDTIEAEDMQALLLFLITPFADLALAQVLRSPIFACSDDDLMALGLTTPADPVAPRVSWWDRLLTLASPSAALRRAAGLLQEWVRLSDRLPVHDLLDRIFSEGDVVARYRAAMAPEHRMKVVANLDAFMEIALGVDAGRYPSLPRFLQELDALRNSPDDAPDEGKLGVGGNAVRIYTVHEAKGLEAPIVWLLDANADRANRDGHDALIHWPSDATQPQHFSMYGARASRGKMRGAMFDDDGAQQAREEMNLLYVAMTRAKQALIVSGHSKGVSRDLARESLSWYQRVAAAVPQQPNPLVCPAPAPAEVAQARARSVSLPPTIPVGARVPLDHAADRQQVAPALSPVVA